MYMNVHVYLSVYGYKGVGTCTCGCGSQQDGMQIANAGLMMYLYGCIHVYLVCVHVALINVFPTCTVVRAECV